MNGFNFKNRQGLKIGNFLIGFSGRKSVANKVGFQTIGKGKTLNYQAFFLVFQGRNYNGFGFDLHYRIIITFFTVVSEASSAAIKIMYTPEATLYLPKAVVSHSTVPPTEVVS